MIGQLALLVGSLVVSVGSGFVLARELDRVGVRLGVTEGMLGILTALGADAPEISTAAVAVLSNKPTIGVGVVLGSNVFNLAALLGLSALVAGGVRVGRHAALLEGSAAIIVALLATGVAMGSIAPLPGLILVVLVIAPYALLASVRPARLSRLPGRRVAGFLMDAVAEVHRDARLDHLPPAASALSVLLIPLTLIGVVGGSVGMVDAASSLGRDWDVSEAVMGTLVLAILTSIPNVVAALRLASHDRGSAVVSEAYNSNSANVLGGLCLPAALIGLGSATGLGTLTAVWALVMTLLSVVLLARAPGLTRRDGAALIAAYLLFVGVVLGR
ncbi:MAG: cation:H+ antiporter [Gaiellales bacterium]|jgi:cation:H+ antiporter|nr:cation:H+ antiporter [Gaiellales bacterium]